MRLHIYLGAFRTAGGHLEAMAHHNHAILNDHGTYLIDDNTYNLAISNAIRKVEGGIDRQHISAEFLAELAPATNAKTLVYLAPLQAGSITRPVGGGLIFPRIKNFSRQLAQVIDPDNLRLFLSIREPSSFLVSCYSQALISAHIVPFDEYTKDVKFDAIRWSNCIERICAPFEDTKTEQTRIHPIIWKFEDYPYIWRDVLGALCGLNNAQELKGTTTPINCGLSLYGSHLMYKYLQKYAPKAPGDFKSVRDAFLEKYPNTGEKPDDPFWTTDQISEMQYSYEDDWYFIERMEMVQTIQRTQIS